MSTFLIAVLAPLPTETPLSRALTQSPVFLLGVHITFFSSDILFSSFQDVRIIPQVTCLGQTGVSINERIGEAACILLQTKISTVC